MDKIGTPSQLLKGQNAIRTDVEQPWEQDNQAWWDWYVSLADNDDPAGELTAAVPLPDVALPDDATLCRELADPCPPHAGACGYVSEQWIYQAAASSVGRRGSAAAR